MSGRQQVLPCIGCLFPWLILAHNPFFHKRNVMFFSSSLHAAVEEDFMTSFYSLFPLKVLLGAFQQGYDVVVSSNKVGDFSAMLNSTWQFLLFSQERKDLTLHWELFPRKCSFKDSISAQEHIQFDLYMTGVICKLVHVAIAKSRS